MAVSTAASLKSGSQEYYTTGSVISRDGTIINYRQFGHGPGVVLMHGTMSTGQNHVELAKLLAGTFTVYVPDRRGLSGAERSDYSIQKEVEDLDALLNNTGAHHVFGVSSGGIICLQAALTHSTIHKVAIYEPPLFINGAPIDLLRRYESEIAQGKVAAALVTAMKAAQMGPPIFNIMPRWLLERLTAKFMASEEKKATGDYELMRELAATLHYDFEIVVEMSGKLERIRPIHTDVLLLGGSKSPAYLKTALDALEQLLPNVTRIEFAGLGHAASWNTDIGGKPEPVAQELRQFFA